MLYITAMSFVVKLPGTNVKKYSLSFIEVPISRNVCGNVFVIQNNCECNLFTAIIFVYEMRARSWIPHRSVRVLFCTVASISFG